MRKKNYMRAIYGEKKKETKGVFEDWGDWGDWGDWEDTQNEVSH
jgi:hypothetical protein